ncbi:hypothetical protein L0Z72_03855 [candidate division KSB1 bacterium]|nr:hypothetical protein [candidate division KSB1 bacterium]
MTQRRDFFKELFSHLYVMKEEMAGRRHFQLTDLWKLDETKFRRLKLRVREGVAIQSDEQEIRSVKKDNEIFFICAKGTDQEKMFHLMQQRLTMGEIAESLTPEGESETETRFPEVREFMLSLVKASICVPANDVYYEPEN